MHAGHIRYNKDTTEQLKIERLCKAVRSSIGHYSSDSVTDGYYNSYSKHY